MFFLSSLMPVGAVIAGVGIASAASCGNAQLHNPVLWEDYPDVDPFRVGDVFYMGSSSFAFSPGAPVLKSYDLANWTPVSHSVPRLDFGRQFSLDTPKDRAYVKGIWASAIRYRESNDMFYWIGCIQQGSTSYVYTSPGHDAAKNNGEVSSWEWEQAASIDTCYYDCGLLIDDDDTMYVSYGNTNISVAQLSPDGLTQVKTQQVLSGGDTYIEGSHIYKIHGYYFIIPTKVASGEWVYRADNPWGPYEMRVFWDNLEGPLNDHAGYAHQGGIIELQSGEFWFVAFSDSYPGGRIPVAAPVKWTEDGWPELVLKNGAWGKQYPIPVKTHKTVPPPTGIDYFKGETLSEAWEFNHNPYDKAWELTGNGLKLSTATVTTDLFAAQNTLTHRVLGPKSIGTFHFDVSGMKEGDTAGAAMFRDQTSYIGVKRTGDHMRVLYVDGLLLNSTWQTQSNGTVNAEGPRLTTSDIWLRIHANIIPAFGLDPVRETTFSYSLDGKTFTRLGDPMLLSNSYTFFTGFRYSAFNFATKHLGGSVLLKSFSMELDD